MMTTNEKMLLERAQLDLERARARADAERASRAKRRSQTRRESDGLSEAFAEAELAGRMAELREVCREEVLRAMEADGLMIDPMLLEVAVDLRARQLLREEIDPEWKTRAESEANDAKLREFEEMMTRWRMPAIVRPALLRRVDPEDQGSKLRYTEPMRALKTDWDARKQVVCLVGLLGAGKTLASCLIVYEEWKERGGSSDVLYCTAREVFRCSDRRDEDREWLGRVERCDVLIIDECGTDLEREDTDSKLLAALLHARYDNNRRTIVLANMLKDEFSRRYTDAVMSRIYQNGNIHNMTQIVRRGELLRQRKLKLGDDA